MSAKSSGGLSPEIAKAAAVRQDRLRKALASEGLDALLISSEKDIRYLTGYVGHDSVMMIHADRGGAIIADPRYDEFLEPWRGADLGEVVMGVRHRLEDSVASLAESQKIVRLGVQAENFTVARWDKLATRIGEGKLVRTTGLVGRLRMVKDANEIEAIERGIEIQQQAIEAALARLTRGMTEMQFCAVLEYEMKMRGSFVPSFETMIASGTESSVIHYQTSMKMIREGVLMVDWGATVDGYCSDMTRTFSIGPAHEKIREIYKIVLDAQTAAIDAIRPGKSCAEIDEVARNVIRKAGYGDFFGHGLGHGLGMDIHEPPFFNELQTDIALEPGMVMTVEPGIYLPGVGGVRIEDDVLVTESGSRVLSSYPKGLEQMEIQFQDSSGRADRHEVIATVGARTS